MIILTTFSHYLSNTSCINIINFIQTQEYNLLLNICSLHDFITVNVLLNVKNYYIYEINISNILLYCYTLFSNCKHKLNTFNYNTLHFIYLNSSIRTILHLYLSLLSFSFNISTHVWLSSIYTQMLKVYHNVIRIIYKLFHIFEWISYFNNVLYIFTCSFRTSIYLYTLLYVCTLHFKYILYVFYWSILYYICSHNLNAVYNSIYNIYNYTMFYVLQLISYCYSDSYYILSYYTLYSLYNQYYSTCCNHLNHYSICYSHAYSYMSSAILTLNYHVAYILILYCLLQYITGLTVASSYYSSLMILLHTHTPVWIICLVVIHYFKAVTNNIIHYISYLHLSVLWPIHLILCVTTITGYSLSHNYLSYEALVIMITYINIAVHYTHYICHSLCIIHILLSIVLILFIAIHLILLHYSTHRYLHSVPVVSYYSLPCVDILLTDAIVCYCCTLFTIVSLCCSSMVSYLPYYSSHHSIPNLYYIHAFLAVTYISLPLYLIIPVMYGSIHYAFILLILL